MMLVRNARLKTIENPLLPIEKSLKIHLTPIGKSIEDPKSIGKPMFCQRLEAATPAVDGAELQLPLDRSALAGLSEVYL